MDLNEYLSSYNRNDYQRDNFDAFLKKVGFSYSIPSIHIAGTNGKGSTANYLAAIYKKEGYKVGLFTSPFLYKVNEMILINNSEISDEDFFSIIKPVQKFIDKYDLSAFEIETYVALKYFENNNVDIAIIECGMGGEIDATNIFTSILSIITSISLEHTMFLGRSLSEIAIQKAGIINHEVPVLIGDLDEDSLSSLSSIAKERKAPIKQIAKYSFEQLEQDGYKFTYTTLNDLKISSKAIYSITDACFAIEGVKLLENKFPIKESSIKEGLKEVKMIARLDIVKDRLIIDGAHNYEGIHNLLPSVEKLADGKKVHIVFSCFRDKNLSTMLSELNYLTSDIYLTTFPHVRARTLEEFFLYLDDYKCEENYQELISNLLINNPDDLVLVTGSLAFASLVKKDVENGLIKYE